MQTTEAPLETIEAVDAALSEGRAALADAEAVEATASERVTVGREGVALQRITSKVLAAFRIDLAAAQEAHAQAEARLRALTKLRSTLAEAQVAERTQERQRRSNEFMRERRDLERWIGSVIARTLDGG